ncbi:MULTISPECIES: endonuclease/exonuclease/phosphatase family protein [Vibrio]|uniref:Endonuclease/exonuclease/phosphatase family protein n=1 Tax=Vibrio cortegadensis TaxID=1328770 RepID=A0ABV4M2G2_9VIBR|nr:endonuclease/exonuclease/phosphatase family protein [Vibrio genomosp. F6]TKF18997.1 endonuclease/exonuclease/phosphatase family protein [Vibrio genomosp. F6]
MKLLKTTAALAITVALLAGCNDEETVNNYLPETPVAPAPAPVDSEGRIAAFNLSFDRYTYEDLVAEMKLTTIEQTALVDGWKAGTLSDEDNATALKVIQIRNVAAIIQTERPAVIMMSEFNNDGTGTNNDALTGFRLNYLAVPQNSNSIDQDGTVLKPISFQYFANFATNTGKLSGYDLNRDGKVATDADKGSYTYANDSWGFGQYHGQYAFALMSQYEIDKDNIRTFQSFKWKDMPGETNPTITDCDGDPAIPAGMACGDKWYTDAAWAEKPMSSKNHVDAPIIITKEDGTEEKIHLLLSHPTPPIFDKLTTNNKMLNRAEIDFWVDYVGGNANYIYDDKGVTGGLESGAHFIVMGDLNADPLKGDGDLTAINALMDHDKVNRLATFGPLAPASLGGPECLALGECKEANWDTPNPDQVTSTSGLRLDHVIPSANLNITESGVHWPATFESGRLLVNDERVGNGNSKAISSDHRLVWIKAEL